VERHEKEHEREGAHHLLLENEDFIGDDLVLLLLGAGLPDALDQIKEVFRQMTSRHHGDRRGGRALATRGRCEAARVQHRYMIQVHAL
jgi:hypothetical protein